MRILHVIPAVAPRYGGPSAAVLGMCRALRAGGIDTLIATTDADGPGRLKVDLGRASIYEGQPAIFFRRRLTESFKWSGELVAWLDAHVSDFDVVHVHAVFSHSSIAAARACAAARVPYIVRPLGTLDPWSVNRKSLRKRVLFQLGVDRMLHGASAIHYTTAEEQRLAEGVVSALPGGAIVPVGIDDELFAGAVGPRARPPYVLSLARLEAKKQTDLLISAFHRAAPGADWRLIVAGDGAPDYVAALKRAAEAGDAASRIEFRGWVSGAAKTQLLRDASLFALTSHQENFGVALVEAMAVGVPPIVTPGVNLASEIFQAEAGWLVDPHEEAVTRTLSAAMGDEADRDRRGLNAHAFATRFRWTRVAGELIALYRAVADARHAAPKRKMA